MEIIFTKDTDWLKKWDTYIINEDKGSHLLLSDWVKSFTSYGFDYELCLCLNKGSIIGGYASVIAKALFFRFYIIPYGPIVSAGFESNLGELITAVPQRAKFHKACYCHITLPASEIVNTHVFANAIPLKAREGHLFKYVYSSNGLNWISLKNFNEDALLESFKSSVRRDIRSSQRKGLDVRFLQTDAELKAGYNLCLENASKNNYALRDWNSFGKTLLKMVNDGSAKFVAAFKDGDLKGAILLVKAGNYYTYILGGTKKEKPDLLAGHLLQWEAIKLSMAENYDGYNISLGGSGGVLEFKNGFNTQQVLFSNSKFHWILKPLYFRMYLFFEKSLRPHKKRISGILSALKNKK